MVEDGRIILLIEQNACIVLNTAVGPIPSDLNEIRRKVGQIFLAG